MGCSVEGQWRRHAVHVNGSRYRPVQVVAETTTDQEHGQAAAVTGWFHEARIKSPPLWAGDSQIMCGMLTNCEYAGQCCQDQLGSTAR